MMMKKIRMEIASNSGCSEKEGGEREKKNSRRTFLLSGMNIFNMHTVTITRRERERKSTRSLLS
jgi:hypothetical protein